MKKKSSMQHFGHDKTSFANLPTDVHMSAYPRQETFSEELDDTITGIDECVSHGKGKVKKYISNQK
jgi:hypothetical protein